MAIFRPTTEHIDWLRDAYPRWPVNEMTRRFNRRFGTDLRPINLKSHCTRRGFLSGRPRGYPTGAHTPVWTPAIRDFLRENIRGRSYEELSRMIESTFGVRITPAAVAAKAKVLGLTNGRDTRRKTGHVPWNAGLIGFQAGGRSAETQFIPGNRPWTYLPIWSWRQDKDGRWMLKVSESDPQARTLKGRQGWRYLHHLTWEEAHKRAVPAGWVVAFVDGDLTHGDDPDNLLAIPRAALLVANRRGLAAERDPAARRVLLTTAHLIVTARAKGRALGIKHHALNRLLEAA